MGPQDGRWENGGSMGRRMLGMGETTIDEVTVRAVKGRKGLRRITWRLGLGDGTTVQCRTEGRCSAAELRERARRQAERRLAEHLGTWSDVTPDSPMAAYCLSRAIEDIEAAATAPDGSEALRPRSVYYLRRAMRLFAEVAGDRSIEACANPVICERLLCEVATRHGRATARHVKSALNRYVFAPLVRREVIKANPCLAPMALPAVNKAHTNLEHGLSVGEDVRLRFLDWLFALDVSGIGRQGRFDADLRRRGWQCVIDMSALQATCGLRIGECVGLDARDVVRRRGHVLVTIEPGKAKTRRGRTVPVTDGRTAEMLLGRVEGLDPDAPVFPIASDPRTRWSDGDLAKRTRRLYDRAADELGVPELRKVSTHVWRATLTTTWKTRGMSASTVAALLGHTPDTSERYYTDGVDMGELLKALDERKGDAEPEIIKFRTA
jgi:site-specific recombinase XerD